MNQLKFDRVTKQVRENDSANAVGLVVHGATAATARPTGYSQILWIGSVEPDNAEDNDIWYSTA